MYSASMEHIRINMVYLVLQVPVSNLVLRKGTRSWNLFLLTYIYKE